MAIAADVLNRMLELGRPEYIRIVQPGIRVGLSAPTPRDPCNKVTFSDNQTLHHLRSATIIQMPRHRIPILIVAAFPSRSPRYNPPTFWTLPLQTDSKSLHRTGPV